MLKYFLCLAVILVAGTSCAAPADGESATLDSDVQATGAALVGGGVPLDGYMSSACPGEPDSDQAMAAVARGGHLVMIDPLEFDATIQLVEEAPHGALTSLAMPVRVPASASVVGRSIRNRRILIPIDGSPIYERVDGRVYGEHGCAGLGLSDRGTHESGRSVALVVNGSDAPGADLFVRMIVPTTAGNLMFPGQGVSLGAFTHGVSLRVGVSVAPVSRTAAEGPPFDHQLAQEAALASRTAPKGRGIR